MIREKSPRKKQAHPILIASGSAIPPSPPNHSPGQEMSTDPATHRKYPWLTAHFRIRPPGKISSTILYGLLLRQLFSSPLYSGLSSLAFLLVAVTFMPAVSAQADANRLPDPDAHKVVFVDSPRIIVVENTHIKYC